MYDFFPKVGENPLKCNWRQLPAFGGRLDASPALGLAHLPEEEVLGDRRHGPGGRGQVRGAREAGEDRPWAAESRAEQQQAFVRSPRAQHCSTISCREANTRS